jgi:hypothetical protein
VRWGRNRQADLQSDLRRRHACTQLKLLRPMMAVVLMILLVVVAHFRHQQ